MRRDGKLLANENTPRLLLANLRQAGHDVRRVLEEQRGIGDPQVFREAMAQERALLTWDKYLGELVFREGREGSCGVILVRVLGTRSQAELAGIVVPVLEAYAESWPLDRQPAGWRRRPLAEVRREVSLGQLLDHIRRGHDLAMEQGKYFGHAEFTNDSGGGWSRR